LWRPIEEFSQLFWPYWSLVETVRAPDGPRQKTLCYLGELNSSAQTRWLKTIEVFNEQGQAQQFILFGDEKELLRSAEILGSAMSRM
jgi:hypothetical protein